MKQIALAAITGSVLFVSAAFAADMPIKTPVAAPPVADWSGIYVGAEVGYGWGKQNTDSSTSGDPYEGRIIGVDRIIRPLTPSLSFPDVAIPSIKQQGWLAGGFFGVQKQWGNWVLGVEGDFDGAGIKGSGTSSSTFVGPDTAVFISPDGSVAQLPCFSPCVTTNQTLALTTKIDALASLRGKVGWSFSPNSMIYATGGAALAHAQTTLVSTQTSSAPVLLSNNNIFCVSSTCTFTPDSRLSASSGSVLFGYAVGGGIDFKFPVDAGSALVFGVEYLHYGFPEQRIGDNVRGTRSVTASTDVDLVKGRISYLFSIR